MSKKPRLVKSNSIVWKQGVFDVSNSSKYVMTTSGSECVYRSSYEWLFMKWCESTDEVKSWSSEPFSIPYKMPHKSSTNNYWIDFVVELQNDELWWVEVKPHKDVVNVEKFRKHYDLLKTAAQKKYLILENSVAATNYFKWLYARASAKAHNAEFKIITEKTLKR